MINALNDIMAFSSMGLFEITPATTTSATGTFDTEIATLSDDFLELFGESVVYYPRGYQAGDARAILAVVDRMPPEGVSEAPYGNAPLLHIFVKNDSTEGISSDELDLGGEQVELSVRLGEAVQKRRITEKNNADAGMLQLEVR